MSITLIHPAPDSGWAGQRLDGVLRHALAGQEFQVVRRAEELSGLEGRRLLLALPLEEGRPFPLEALFCLGRIQRVEGTRCVVYAFREEEPVLWREG